MLYIEGTVVIGCAGSQYQAHTAMTYINRWVGEKFKPLLTPVDQDGHHNFKRHKGRVLEILEERKRKVREVADFAHDRCPVRQRRQVALCNAEQFAAFHGIYLQQAKKHACDWFMQRVTKCTHQYVFCRATGVWRC